MDTNKQNKEKKKWYQKWWVWVIIAWLVLGIIGGASPDTSAPQESNPTEESSLVSTDSEPIIDEQLPLIELIAGQPNEYSSLFTINKGTEFEETYYVYRVPAGTYTVTNSGQYMSQIGVYSDEIHVTDEGWEEPTTIYYTKLLDVGESDTFTFGIGQYIEIHEPSQFSLEKIEE